MKDLVDGELLAQLRCALDTDPGLSWLVGLIHNLGGELHCSEREPLGSRITLRLPAVDLEQ